MSIKSQKSSFCSLPLGFWLPALPPPGLLPWKPNLPGNFDFAWEGWWCVRLLRGKKGFLRAWCWKGGVLSAPVLFRARKQTVGQRAAAAGPLIGMWAPKDERTEMASRVSRQVTTPTSLPLPYEAAVWAQGLFKRVLFLAQGCPRALPHC